jgi:hypothetical protein
VNRPAQSYYAFLVRIWHADEDHPPAAGEAGGTQAGWRASLEDPHTHNVHSFSSLEALSQFFVGLAAESRQAEGE